jgi:hypothetical protein
LNAIEQTIEEQVERQAKVSFNKTSCKSNLLKDISGNYSIYTKAHKEAKGKDKI